MSAANRERPLRTQLDEYSKNYQATPAIAQAEKSGRLRPLEWGGLSWVRNCGKGRAGAARLGQVANRWRTPYEWMRVLPESHASNSSELRIGNFSARERSTG